MGMSFIDWSDRDELLGLLAEYVADERLGEQEDRERRSFLAALSATLASVHRMRTCRPPIVGL